MKKIRVILISVLVLALIGIGLFYYRIGIGFGEASVKTIEAVQEIKSDLKEKNINLIDSIETKLDSIKKRNDTISNTVIEN